MCGIKWWCEIFPRVIQTRRLRPLGTVPLIKKNGWVWYECCTNTNKFRLPELDLIQISGKSGLFYITVLLNETQHHFHQYTFSLAIFFYYFISYMYH